MITTIRSYVHQGRRLLYKLQTDPRVHTAVQIALHLLTGFFLTAASLRNLPQTFALGLVCASSGWSAALIALGGCLGYPVFWGSAGVQGILWMAAGLGFSLVADLSASGRTNPLLLPF